VNYATIRVPPVEIGRYALISNDLRQKLTVYTSEPDVPIVELDPGEWLIIGEIDGDDNDKE